MRIWRKLVMSDKADEQIYIHVYRVIERLGKGAFSSVFKAEHRTNGRLVAIKVEPEHATIKHESQILSYLGREMNRGAKHFVPTLHWYGIYGNNVCLAIPFYPQTLASFVKRDNLLSILDVCHQMVCAFRWIHETGIIHCDVKPDNFMVNERGKVVVIDFGLASVYVVNGEHRPNIATEHIIGSPKYASYFVHQGNRISRRDDLISVGYMAMWCFGVEMEWSNIYTPDCDLPIYHIRHPGNVLRARCKKPENIMAKISNQYLKSYFECVYSLEHDEDPNYNEYLRIFSTLY